MVARRNCWRGRSIASPQGTAATPAEKALYAPCRGGEKDAPQRRCIALLLKERPRRDGFWLPNSIKKNVLGLRLASPPLENCLLNRSLRRSLPSTTLALVLCSIPVFAGLARKRKATPPPPPAATPHASAQLDDKK